jgi:Flp pilus assembly protein TadD
MRSGRFSAYLSVGFLIAFLGCAVMGQSRVNQSGTGGIHTIQGKVYLPNGRTSETSYLVKLQSTNFSTISVNTDQGGSFVFSAIAPGSYSIVVEAGDPFEVAHEYVVIDADIKIEGAPSVVTAKTVNVPVYLQFKRATRVAVQVYNAKLAAVPKEAVKHYENGLKLSQANKTDDALLEFRQAVALYPAFGLAYNEIGKICLYQEKNDEAESAFRSALGVDGLDFEAKLHYGVVLMKKNELRNAQKELEEAKTINQTAAAPPYYLGLIFMSLRKFPEAKGEFELTEKLKSTRDYPLAHYYLGGIYWSEKQYKKAADELEKYLQIEPKAKGADQTRKTIQELRTKEN